MSKTELLAKLKSELLAKLTELQTLGDEEIAHREADNLLLEWIDDDEITAAYDEIDK